MPVSVIRSSDLAHATPRPRAGAPAPRGEPGPLFLDAVPLAGALRYAAAWSDLVDRALEPNPFLEPGFLLPLHQHTRSPDIDLLFVWADETPTAFSRLLGVIPLRGAGGGRLLRGLRHPQLACGLPLIDAESAPAVLAAALDWLAKTRPGAAGLLLEEIPADGPFAACLRDVATARGLAVAPIDRRTRAVLTPGPNDVATLCFRSAHRRKEHARQVRRLSERGDRTVRVADTPEAVARALEQFLALEQAGWKGRRGTAFLSQPRLVTFVRTMMRHFAAEGRGAVHALELDGQPIAMGLVLRQGTHAYFWKTAYDERLAPLSPGVQLTVELSRRQRADPDVALTDSCAIADHPMIDALWPERQIMVDLAVSLRHDDRARFVWTIGWERRRRGAIRVVKRLLARFQAKGLPVRATKTRSDKDL